MKRLIDLNHMIYVETLKKYTIFIMEMYLQMICLTRLDKPNKHGGKKIKELRKKGELYLIEPS